MSEPKRIALIPIGGGESLTQLPVKKDKKTSKLPKTQRFTLTLDDSTEKSCPEFNFAALLTSSTKKKDTTNGSSAPNPLDPFEDDDEDQLRNIAKKFEEKYGLPVGKKKKSRKYDDYVDLGAGYDETDPFIDNTDAYDEVVPAEVTTAHGGFYINSGALEFKTTGKNSESESESSSSSSESESDDDSSDMSTAGAGTGAGNTKKRRIIESDDDSGDGNIPAPPSGIPDANIKKKRPRLEEVAEQNLAKPKKPLPKADAVEVESTKPIIPKDGGRVNQTKKDLTESTPKSKLIANNNQTTAEEGVKGVEASQKSENKPLPEQPRNSLALPVVANNEANGSSSSSSDSSDSSSSSDSESEEEDGVDDDEAGKEKGNENDEASKLPSTLTSSTIAAIEEIKKAAVSSDKQGKCRFFSPEINRLLLAVELQARQYSCSKRQAIYTYLTRFLPCTKHTLLKRAKNLVLDDVESKLKPAIQKLQVAIEKVMGEQIERHATQCQRLAEANPERYLEYYRYAWDPDLEPAGASDEDEKKTEKSSKPAHPRRRFQWNKEIRSILNQVVYLKMECYNWSKLRKESASEYLMRFLESDIKHLWPKGWMTSRILFKESKEAHAFVTTKGAVKPGPAAKKSVGGVVDALIPPLPSSSMQQNISTNSSVPPTQNQGKEPTKSHPKERIPTAPPTLTRPEGIAAVALLNQVKEQAKSNQKERLPSTIPAVSITRQEVTAAAPRHENNGSFNKFDKAKPEPIPQPSKVDSVPKPRQRADTVPRLDNKDVKTLPRASGFSEATSLVKPTESDSLYSAKSDFPADLSKNRSNNIRESIIQLCPDITVIKNENPNSRPLKADTPKIRFESTAASSSDPPKFNRADSLTSSDNKTQYDEVQCLTTSKFDANTGKSENLGDSNIVNLKTTKSKSSAVPSSSSLASFVDSGLRWTGRDTGHSKSVENFGSDTSQRKNVESYNRQESSAKEPSPPEQEDEESLLQRDLEKVLEQIGQINQVESKDQNPTQQSGSQISVIGEPKTKSVIKTTASANLSSPMVVPHQAPSKPPTVSLSQRTMTSSSGSASSSNRPTGPATSSPSSSHIQQSQTGHIKFAHSASKMLPGDLLNHMPSFTPNWQSYYSSDNQSPEKRKSESTSPQHPPANQLHGGPSYVPRSSPSTIHRNLPPSTTHVLPASSNSAFLKNVSHTVESMLQQTPHSQALPIHDSHMSFLQRKSQKPPENNYYSIHGPSDPANSS